MDTSSGVSAATLTEESTFPSRSVAEGKEPDRLMGGHASQSTSSSPSEMSDDLHGLLVPGRNVILRFESMSAAELKVRRFLCVGMPSR